MKKTITSLSIIFCCLFAFGQKAEEYEDVIKNAPFIFEGKVLSFNAIQGDDKEYFVSYVLEANKIFRGNDKLKTGTIEMVTELPQYWQVTEYNGE